MSKAQTTWEEIKIREFPQLSSSLSADVAIIGGGITGALSTYLLSKRGKKVALIEKGKIAGGATGMTTAFLTQSLDTDCTDLIKIYGQEKAEQIADFHRDAIDLIEQIIKEEHIECDFTRCSNYIYTHTDTDIATLAEEYAAMKKLGIHASYKSGRELGIADVASIEIYNQAKFHPLKFLKGILEAAEKNGANIFEHTEAKEMSAHNLVRTDQGDITADWIISATYEPFGNPLGLFFKKGMYVSYVYEIEMARRDFKDGMYEDTENPYHYFRIDNQGSITQVIIGGEDHRQDIPVDVEKNFKALKEFIDETFPSTKYEVTRRWSGPILEPIDGLAFIGPHKEKNILYVMGFSGNGMTYSAIAATIFSDIIFGKENRWLSLYRADRISSFKSLLIKGRDYFEELFHGAVKNTLIQKK